MSHGETVRDVDPFDLPEWLGTEQVTWVARSSVHEGHRVEGELTTARDGLGCDLLAVDQAFPQAVVSEDWRQAAHQAWTHGQVLLIEYDGRLTLAVPGTGFTADRVLETIGRLAKAVGVKPSQFTATLRL